MLLWASCVVHRYGYSYSTTVILPISSSTMSEAAIRQVLILAAKQISHDNGTSIAPSQVAILQMEVLTTFISDGI